MQLQRLALAPAQLTAAFIPLTLEQQHYLYRVLRLQAGDRVVVFDGQGQSWVAQVTAEAGQLQRLDPLRQTTELPVSLTLVAALPKGNGFDEVVRQVTELGVQRIIPVLSDRTLLQPSAHKLERWRRIALEAAEQSERQLIPTIEVPLTWPDYLQTWAQSSPAPRYGYLGVTRQEVAPLLTQLQAQPPTPGTEVSLAIGPEGGWTATEVSLAIASGYRPMALGQRILRAVTAAVTAVAIAAAVAEVGPTSLPPARPNPQD